MSLKLNNKYSIGQIVYFVTDPDQVERQVIYIKVTPNGLQYGINTMEDGDLEVYDIEISETKRYDING